MEGDQSSLSPGMRKFIDSCHLRGVLGSVIENVNELDIVN